MTNGISLEILKKFPLFQDFSDEDLVEIQPLLHHQRLKKDEILLLEGVFESNLIFVLRGWFKAEKISPEGRQQTLRFIGPMEIINEYSVFSDEPNRTTIIAMEDAEVFYLIKSDVDELLLKSPTFSRAVITNLSKRIELLLRHVENLSLYSVEQRLARYLLEGEKDGVVKREKWKTQAEIAAHLGTVVDVVNRALQKFEKQNIILINRSQFQILDRDKLLEITRNPARGSY